jgi:N-ethylmaleimide reductase
VYYGGPAGYTDLSCYKPSKGALLEPYKMGDLKLPNRVVMAAMTRCRAGPDGIPSSLHAEYYSSRASSGFMFTECAAVSAEGNNLQGAACLYTDGQEEGWKKVVKAVHDKGGRILL